MSAETKPPDICGRTFDFAVRIVNLCKYLEERSWVARTLGQQILRSGTSIGSNIEEAQAAHSRAEFINKNVIALREARETHFWLRLLEATSIVPETKLAPLRAECDELKKILGAIVISARKRGGVLRLFSFFLFPF